MIRTEESMFDIIDKEGRYRRNMAYEYNRIIRLMLLLHYEVFRRKKKNTTDLK